MPAFDQPRQRQGSGAFLRCFAEALGGSRAALGDLLEPLRRYLMVVAEAEMDGRLCAKMTASDVVQQTFLQAQQALNNFSGQTEDEWRGWLRRILLNEIAQADRYYRQAAKRDIGREVALPDDDSSEDRWQLPSPEETPYERAAINEELARLGRALETLPVEYRRVVEMRNAAMSFDQIGLTMNRSAAAAQKLWTRAVRQLSSELGDRRRRPR